ncbi:MAG: carboxypeptidase-like regulatory domain-containing protein, partial [Hymenobacter sp.]
MSHVSALYKYLLISLLLLLVPGLSVGQTRYILSGTVRGADGPVLPGATVVVPALSLGTATAADGTYSLSVPAGTQQVVVSFVGYTTETAEIKLTRNQKFNFTLPTNQNELGEVIVQGQQTLKEKLNTTQMGVEHLSIREAKLLPALFGEVDILKTLQLKPGVQSVDLYKSGFPAQFGGRLSSVVDVKLREGDRQHYT